MARDMVRTGIVLNELSEDDPVEFLKIVAEHVADSDGEVTEERLQEAIRTLGAARVDLRQVVSDHPAAAEYAFADLDNVDSETIANLDSGMGRAD